MVSRRKILSRSRDELHSELFNNYEEEQPDDIWRSKEKLYQVGKKNFFVRVENRFLNALFLWGEFKKIQLSSQSIEEENKNEREKRC